MKDEFIVLENGATEAEWLRILFSDYYYGLKQNRDLPL